MSPVPLRITAAFCLVALAIPASGCSSKQATGQALSAAGVTAVVVAAAIAANDQRCEFDAQGVQSPAECRARKSDDNDKAAAIVAAAGMGVALAGQALQQQNNFDAPQSTPRVKTPVANPWHLQRPAGFDPAKPEPVAAEESAPGQNQAAPSTSVTLAVDGVSCASCVIGIRKALLKHDGVLEVSEGKDIHEVVVKFNPKKTNATAIVAVVLQAGFKSRVVSQ